MSDRVLRCLARRPQDEAPTLRLFIAETGALVEHARLVHALKPLAAVALGRALTGGVLLSALIKSERNVNLQFAGDGPLGGVFVDVEPSFGVRGYVNHDPERKLRLGGRRPSLGLALGQKGFVNVMRADASGHWFRGSVAIKSGEIDDDLGEYLATSEQVESAIALDVVMSDGAGAEEVAAAGGVLVQVLATAPGASLAAVREKLSTRVLYALMQERSVDWAEAICEALGLTYDLLEEHDVRYQCNCSEKRVQAAIMAAGVAELDDMINKDGKAEVTCDFCRRHYLIDKEQLQKLRDLAVSVALSHKDRGDHDDN